MDVFTLKGMSFEACHGVYETEKKHPNTFEVDVSIKNNFVDAGKTDDLSKTLDYTEIHALAANVMNGPSQNLIESLCYKIGQAIFEAFNPAELSVTVRKLNPPLEGKTQYSEIRMQWPK